MSVTQQYCYTHPSGEDIYLFVLRNARGTEVLISNYGAILVSYKIKKNDGAFNDIVLGFDKIEDYSSPAYRAQYPWFGAAIGRYANRVKDASFSIDGKNYKLQANRPGEHLHGGEKGFDKKIWQFAGMGESPEAFLELKCKSPDGEEGYPGNLAVSIRFELDDEDALSYQYTGITDQPTAINLTHHSYFNLENGRGTIVDHAIRIYASNLLEQDENLVATGNVLPVAGTAFDFRQFQLIREKLKQVSFYDQSFEVDKNNAVPGKDISLVAEAKSERSGTLLQVYSTEPVLHFYSGKWIPDVTGKNGNHYGSSSGFCLETQKHPNAINIRHFPNTILRPGEKYYQKTVYRVSSF